jgi:phosphoribosyl 1,2-cyclic phosphate phosphodiesterase
MRLTILGTAAAEAWPAPFCRCRACQEARRRGGPNLRSRAGALLDDDLKIDFGPDTVMQLIRAGRDLCDLKTIVFTHQHSDHIVPSELEWSGGVFTNTPPAEPIVVYGNEDVCEMIHMTYPDPRKLNLEVRMPMETGIPVRTPTGDTILPLLADHVAGSFVLRIERADGRAVFWGHDSGLYPADTLDALEKAGPVHIATFDCTYGGAKSSNRGHMGIDGVVEMVTELYRRGVVTAETKLVATHFSHNGGLLHEELVEAFLPHGILVAYDGILIEA